MTKYAGSLDEAPEFLNLLLYGEPGSGKTSNLATMANMGRMFLLDVEAGAKARALRRLGINTRNITPVPIARYRDLDDFHWWLKAELDSDPGFCVGFGIDSISEIHDMLITEQTGVRHAKAVRKAGAGMEVEDDEFAVELNERGVVTEQLRRLSRRFRDLPCHTVWTALVKSDIDQSGSGGKVLRPALPPKFCNNLAGYVDVVGYCTRAEGVDDESGYLGVFRETGMYRGKDRLGGLPPVLALPTFQRIHSITMADMDPEQDEVHGRYLARVAARTPKPEPQAAESAAEQEAQPAAAAA
jgi:hypothetical protein